MTIILKGKLNIYVSPSYFNVQSNKTSYDACKAARSFQDITYSLEIIEN